MNLRGQEKIVLLLALFRETDVSNHIAAARRVYEDHLTALATLRIARRCSPEDRREAERHAALHRARWRRCRERIIVMTWAK